LESGVNRKGEAEMQRKAVYGLVIFTVVFLLSCTSGQLPVILKIDTPLYHVDIGDKMLDLYKIDSAFREFSRAVEMDPKYSPAYVGLGLVHGYYGDYASATVDLESADRYARGKEQEVAVFVGYMRLNLIAADRLSSDWLKRVETRFNQAVVVGDDFPAPYYYMGMAYKAAGKLDLAAKKFYRVIELGKGYIKRATKEYETLEKKK